MVACMTRDEILGTLVRLARKTFEEDELAFDAQTLFADIEDWDSPNHIHMVSAMEKAFAIRFELSDLQRLERVSDLIDVIARRCEAAGPARQ
jgi:acyl carrier protein